MKELKCRGEDISQVKLANCSLGRTRQTYSGHNGVTGFFLVPETVLSESSANLGVSSALPSSVSLISNVILGQESFPELFRTEVDKPLRCERSPR